MALPFLPFDLQALSQRAVWRLGQRHLAYHTAPSALQAASQDVELDFGEEGEWGGPRGSWGTGTGSKAESSQLGLATCFPSSLTVLGLGHHSPALSLRVSFPRKPTLTTRAGHGEPASARRQSPVHTHPGRPLWAQPRGPCPAPHSFTSALQRLGSDPSVPAACPHFPRVQTWMWSFHPS